MTATTRGSPVGGNDSQGQAPDAQSQPPLPQNQRCIINNTHRLVELCVAKLSQDWPFGQCYEFLTLHTVKKYFLPVIEMVPQFLENLTDEELKKEAKNEAKNDALSMIIKSLKNLASRVPGQEETVKNLEIFRLKMILRLLQISSFNGKMNALNEVNKVISSVSYYTHRHNPEEEEWLTAERMAEWIQQNHILSIVLRDSLHQPQYVEKLEKILRFVIKEKALTMQDLDNIWAAQAGKHEAIVKNVHDLLAKLAWDFSPEQLDHLFDCFKASWTNASKKQREKLLELIRRLAEDDKDGVMAHKVLNLLWNLAHSDDVPVDIMDQALSAHIKILDYSCSQVEIHEDFIQSCFDRLKASYDTLCVLDGDKDSINCARQEAIRMVRVLTVLKEYINECDSDYHEERTILPMSRAVCLDHAKLGENSLSPSLDSRFFGPSPSQVLYLIEVVYALLMPASATLGEDASDFQYNFLKSGGLPLVLSMLTRNNFLPSADMETRRGAYLNALKIAKLLLTAVGFGHVKAVAEACQPNADGNIPVSPATHDQALVLQSALQNIPNPASECMLRNVAIRLAQQISDETNAAKEPDGEDEQVCCEALEVMTLCFALMPTALDTLRDYFTLLRHLLNYAYNSNINLPNAEVLLNNEIDWLKRIRVRFIFQLVFLFRLKPQFQFFSLMQTCSILFVRMRLRGQERLVWKKPSWRATLVSPKSF
ncbi:hypothetical protein XENOCAPTIV_010855 [Xenoophorus captivus]|uniref:ubiquitinyl hydrolase 1 n=1 Tax=Xenoophorus captivus TaxID=1517983 RepID=A0ABV0QKJ5_9TELE